MLPALAAAAVGHGAESLILGALAFVLVGAKLAGAVVERLGQPAVLGELVFGILLGNLALAGGPSLLPLQASETFRVLAELGAILLLFEVGLESTPREMLAASVSATVVALVGVAAPMLLGFGAGHLLLPGKSWLLHAFLGAMLAATSVGITARVLQDAGAIRAPAARLILGAAVIDDVLGLVVLAIIAGVIEAAARGETLAVSGIVAIVAKALAFLVGALAIGSYLSPRLFKGALELRARGVVLALALGFCFGLAWLAGASGLAPIVGAFAAGLVLEDVHLEAHQRRGEDPLHVSLRALSGLLVPVFFVRMGMQVDLGSFLRPGVIGFALALTLCAMVGKWVCGLVVPRGISRITVGVGMMPRGEVGLIFAGIGAALSVGGQPVVAPDTYAAAVFMVVATTVATPPLLLWSLRR